MKVDFTNGCVFPETLKIYDMFIGNPHCHTFSMSSDEESVSVGFTHYGDEFFVTFNSLTGVGEVFRDYECKDGESFTEFYGEITVGSLYRLLNTLPHIDKYLL